MSSEFYIRFTGKVPMRNCNSIDHVHMELSRNFNLFVGSDRKLITGI